MVKKKAVKHQVKHVKKKNEILKVKRPVKKPQATAAPKVEKAVEIPKLEYKPEVIERPSEVPKIEEKPFDGKSAEIERPSAPSINIKPSDEALSEVGWEVKRKSHLGSYIAWAIVIVLVTGFIFLSIQTTEYTRTVDRNVTKTVETPQVLSFGKLMNVTDVMYNEKVTVTGYLSDEINQTDAVTKKETKYVVDDSGNRIRLLLGYTESNLYDKLFVTSHTTDFTYNVTGIFKYNYNGFVIEVTNITAQKKGIQSVVTSSIEKQPVNESSRILNFSYAMSRILKFK